MILVSITINIYINIHKQVHAYPIFYYEIYFFPRMDFISLSNSLIRILFSLPTFSSSAIFLFCSSNSAIRAVRLDTTASEDLRSEVKEATLLSLIRNLCVYLGMLICKFVYKICTYIFLYTNECIHEFII